MDKNAVEKLFSLAIKRELEAHEFYNQVATRTKNDDVKKVFAQLAAEEMQHRETLEKLQMDPTMVMKFVAPVKDYKVAEATEEPVLSIDMKPADAIALAMKKEQGAVEFYRGLAEQTEDAEMNKIFSNLVNMELAHKARLENVFVEIGYPEVF